MKYFKVFSFIHYYGLAVATAAASTVIRHTYTRNLGRSQERRKGGMTGMPSCELKDREDFVILFTVIFRTNANCVNVERLRLHFCIFVKPNERISIPFGNENINTDINNGI